MRRSASTPSSAPSRCATGLATVEWMKWSCPPSNTANRQNPYLDKRYALERDEFQPVMDEYYALRGWDVETGWRLESTLPRQASMYSSR